MLLRQPFGHVLPVVRVITVLTRIGAGGYDHASQEEPGGEQCDVFFPVHGEN